MVLTSDEDEDKKIDPSKLNTSSTESLNNEKKSSDGVPDVHTWDKFKLHAYLLKRLPQTIADKILLHVRYRYCLVFKLKYFFEFLIFAQFILCTFK